MKKKLQFLTKTLLVVAALCVGANSAWAGTKTLYPTGTTDPTKSSAWTYHSDIVATEEDGYIIFKNGKSNAQREMYLPFYTTGNDFYSTYETYTVSFDFWTFRGWAHDTNGESTPQVVLYSEGATVGAVASTFSARNTSKNNYLMLWSNTATQLDLRTMYINGSNTENFTIAQSTWYTATITITVSTGNVSYTIRPQAGGTALASGNYTATTDGTSYKCQGLYFSLGRNCQDFYIANVKVTTETDEEVVSDPTFNVAYAGDNRTVTISGGTSSESNTVTTYYTTDGTDPTSSSSVYSSALDISSDCTVKAISISSEGTESSIASQAITVGKLTLAAPTFTKTAYSAGSYTISIADNQSALEFVPASTTIKYRIGTTGDFTTYSSAVAVPDGKTLYAYAEAVNYTTSSTSAVSAKALPAMTLVWEQNFKGVATSDFQMEITTDGGAISKGIAADDDANYYTPSEDGTSKLTNANIGFYVAYASNGNHRRWKMYSNGTTGIWNMVNANVDVHIYNLVAGQIVKVEGSALYAGSGVLTALTAFDYGTTRYYQVNSNGTGVITVTNQAYLNSINVYNVDNEIVGSMDYTTPYWNKWNTTPVVINAGETGYYKFVNHNNSGAAFQNWYLYAANDNKNYVVLRADNTQNKQTVDAVEYTGTISSFPTTSDIVADLCDATVELTVALTKSDATYTLTSTAHITKADGTVMSPDYVFTQTGLPTSSMNLFVSVENSWIEILKQAVKKDITAAGYATYYSSNALDFANAEPSLTASIVTGATGSTLDMTDINDAPAETGVILAGDAGTYTIPVIASSSTNVTGNKLEGVHAATAKDANSIYVLMASPKVGFYSNNKAFTVGANTAYLPAGFDGTGAPVFYLFDNIGGTTGIDTVNGSEFTVNGEYYNVAGQRVAQPTKGLYIVNGKKVVVK